MRFMRLGRNIPGAPGRRHLSVRRFLLLSVLATAVLLTACGGQSGASREITLAPVSQLPPEVAKAPPQVREAYQFALANPDLLSAFPCYCGCGAMGHRSNLDCYVQSFNSDGSVVFENHAFA